MEAQHRPEQTAKLPQAQESVIAPQGQSVVEDLDMREMSEIAMCPGLCFDCRVNTCRMRIKLDSLIRVSGAN